MSDNITSIFERYAKPVSKVQQAENSSKKIYRPFDLEPNGIPVNKLRVNFSSGEIMVFNYGNMIDLYATNGTVSLLFTTGAVYMQGDNLYELIDEIQRDRIYALHAYDPNQHTLNDKTPVVIHKLEFQHLTTQGKAPSR